MKDDFDRNVYCLLGIPIDVVTMTEALSGVEDAIQQKTRCFLSTPNLNFLIQCFNEATFRQSLILSDLVIADGMPLVMIGKLLGLPLQERVAGSTLFERMLHRAKQPPTRIYFFGGPEGVAEKAMSAVNSNITGMQCVGALYPGFQTLEQMSSAAYLNQINAANPDFLIVSLGAKNGQAWVMRNLSQLNAPVISHLGAVVNFVAGTVKRAPVVFQTLGLEWLWRIKEEPALWRRYFNDGLALFKLMICHVLPMAFNYYWSKGLMPNQQASFKWIEAEHSVTLKLIGDFRPALSQEMRHGFRAASAMNKSIIIDCAEATFLGVSILGFFLLLQKNVLKQGNTLHIVHTSKRLRRLLEQHRLGYLLQNQ